VTIAGPASAASSFYPSFLTPREKLRLVAIWPDMLYLSIFAFITLGIATPLFKRTL
jgi:hypothetical protein